MAELTHISDAVKAAMPLEVELPVCPTCFHVGKHPGQQRMRFDCTGPPGAIHKRQKMRLVRFREVREDEAA